PLPVHASTGGRMSPTQPEATTCRRSSTARLAARGLQREDAREGVRRGSMTRGWTVLAMALVVGAGPAFADHAQPRGGGGGGSSVGASHHSGSSGGGGSHAQPRGGGSYSGPSGPESRHPRPGTGSGHYHYGYGHYPYYGYGYYGYPYYHPYYYGY